MANAVKEERTRNNRGRRIAADLARKARDATKASRRLILRRRGAVNRLVRRISDASEGQRARLMDILVKVAASHANAVKAAP